MRLESPDLRDPGRDVQEDHGEPYGGGGGGKARPPGIVGLSAIKYGDLSNQASKDYVFDVDRFTSFEGNTGPYILYTIVRIKSILNKYQAEGADPDKAVIRGTDEELTRALMLQLRPVQRGDRGSL